MTRGSTRPTQGRQPPASWAGALFVVMLAAALAACATTGADRGEPEVSADGGPSSLMSMGIPLNAVPDAGLCRIWRPRSPATRQKSARRCRLLEGRVGQGGWLLRHPEPAEDQPHRIHLLVYGDDGPALVRIFDRETGQLVKEKPAEEVELAAGADEAGRDSARADDPETPDRAGDDASGGADEAPSLYSLGIPRGAVPPGRCRIWDPELRAEEQSSPGRCDELRVRVGGDDWLLQHRPAEAVEGGDTGRLVVSVYEAGRVVAIRVFDVATGVMIEERMRQERKEEI